LGAGGGHVNAACFTNNTMPKSLRDVIRLLTQASVKLVLRIYKVYTCFMRHSTF